MSISFKTEVILFFDTQSIDLPFEVFMFRFPFFCGAFSTRFLDCMFQITQTHFIFIASNFGGILSLQISVKVKVTRTVSSLDFVSARSLFC